MQPPFILAATHPSSGPGGDARIFQTAGELTLQLEAIDVENGEYVVYDSEGRLLCLSACGGDIVLDAAEDNPEHVDALHHLLEQHLLVYGEWAGLDREWMESASLSELLEKVAEVGERWANRPTPWKRVRAWLRGDR